MLKSSPEMISAVLKFEIRKKFSEWEQAVYNHQPIARTAGIFELYHGHEPDNEQTVCVFVHACSEQHMQNSWKRIAQQLLYQGTFLNRQILQFT